LGLLMPSDAAAPRPASPPHVLDFARAFRAAARAVGFYPATHQNVVAALDQVTMTARAATGSGSMCLTVLPQGLLAGGIALDPSERAFSDLAGICHRHGIGALILDGRAGAESWRALLTLLARKPEEVRAAGGVHRQWKALRQISPAILEIDFGALLRGQVGGDFNDLAGVISHYLETAGIGGSILDDPCGALQRAIEAAPDEPEAIAGLLRELRAAAQLTWSQHDQFDDVFRRAAAVGEFLTESLMERLLERRGKPDAMVGTIDVVEALVERMPDTTVSKFLSRAMGADGAATTRLTEVFTSLVPDAQRRQGIVGEAQDVTIDANVLDQWAALERNLDAYADRRFLSDQYVDEIHGAQIRADRARRERSDPPERVAAWVHSIGDDRIRELDLAMLGELARLETETTRAHRVVEILQSNVFDAMTDGDWAGVATTVEVIRGVATGADDRENRAGARDVLERLMSSKLPETALELLTGCDDPTAACLVRTLSAVGPALIPTLVARWAGERREVPRSRLEQIVAACGRPGREALRRLLSSDGEATDVRVAAARLLELTPGTEHLSNLEAALSDPEEEVRRVAFDALASSTVDKASDILARGIAKADGQAQAALLNRLFALGEARTRPVLQRVFRYVDPARADVPVYLTMISALARTCPDVATPLLADAVRRTTWRAPVRAWRVRSAVRVAVRTLRAPDSAAADPLRKEGDSPG
jgi:hypothetical protein